MEVITWVKRGPQGNQSSILRAFYEDGRQAASVVTYDNGDVYALFEGHDQGGLFCAQNAFDCGYFIDEKAGKDWVHRMLGIA